MNVSDLEVALTGMGVRPDAYCLRGGHPSEAYVLAHTVDGWRVYYSERGAETSAVAFPTESEACEHLLHLITCDPSTRI